MSPLFLKQFAVQNKCGHCAQLAQAGYKTCPQHLEAAKLKWRSWSMERRAQGKCSYCSNKAFNGWLRCRKHTRINRDRCRAWMKVNGARIYAERKAYCLETGLCLYCSRSKARPVIPGTLRCEYCRNRTRSSQCKS